MAFWLNKARYSCRLAVTHREKPLLQRRVGHKPRSDHECNKPSKLELQCESLDCQINEAVYEFFGLTKEEIEIVEGKE
jgi:hypothetical protein